MASTLIARVAFNLRTFQYRAGNLSVLGLLMLVVALVLYLSMMLPQARHLHSAEMAFAQFARHHAPPAIPHDRQTALSTHVFFKQFPSASEKEAALKTIIAIAEKNTLPLDAGKYETLTKESGQVVFYRISFPLKGAYPQIKQFLAKSLNTLPNAALSQIHFHHASGESNQVEAEVIFTLYFTKAP